MYVCLDYIHDVLQSLLKSSTAQSVTAPPDLGSTWPVSTALFCDNGDHINKDQGCQSQPVIENRGDEDPHMQVSKFVCLKFSIR